MNRNIGSNGGPGILRASRDLGCMELVGGADDGC